MTPNRAIAEGIVKVIQENEKSEDITKNTKNKLIKEVCKRLNVGSSSVTDILSQLYGFEVVYYRTIQRAKVYFVNKKNLGELEKIKD